MNFCVKRDAKVRNSREMVSIEHQLIVIMEYT